MMRAAPTAGAAAAAMALSIASPALAQTSPLLTNPGFHKQLGGVLEKVNKTFAGHSEEARIERALDGMKSAVRDDLQWTGQNGYLVQIRAFVDAEGNLRMLQGPSPCGSAMTPVDALTICMSVPGFQQGEVQGLRFSSQKSYFIWARRKKPPLGIGAETVEYGTIPSPYSTQLWQETATILASKTVVSEVVAARNREAIAHAVETARARMNSAQERQLLAETHARLEAQRAETKRIDRELAETLDRIAAANAMLRQIDMMQGILSLATTIASVKATVGPGADTASLDSLQSVPAVRSWLGDYSRRLETESRTMMQNLDAARARAEQSRQAVMDYLGRYKAPATILY